MLRLTFLRIIVLFLLLLSSQLVNASLFAMTQEKIKGQPPIYNKTLLNKLAFIFNGEVYSVGLDNLSNLSFDGNMKYSTFSIATTLHPAADFADFSDDDGDDFVSVELINPTLKWIIDNNGKITDVTANLQNGGTPCINSPLDIVSGNLKLRVESSIKVTSLYGYPSSEIYPSIEIPEEIYQDYPINIKPTICGLVPKNMYIQPNTFNKGGGSTADFNVFYGFTPNPTVSNKFFPTTGFSGASFTIKMFNSQSNFVYQSSDPDNVDVDQANGVVTLKNKPDKPVTLTVKEINGDGLLNYTFNIKNWFIPVQGNNKIFYSEALTACGKLNARVPSRAELTNSPQNSAPRFPTETLIPNYFTRAIDGGLVGEWGRISTYNDWAAGFYWTSEIWATEGQHFPSSAYMKEVMFMVNMTTGLVTHNGNAPVQYAKLDTICVN